MTSVPQTYEEAVAIYREQFAALLDVPPDAAVAATRGAGDVPTEQLIARADAIANISAQMIALGRDYRESGDMATREGITAHFLTQATAEAQLAAELLEIAAADQAGPSPQTTTRADRTTALRDAINAVDQVVTTPVTAGIAASLYTTRAAAATTVEEGTTALRTAASQATVAISQRVVELGGDLAYSLVIGTDWNEVRNAAALFRQDVAAQLDKVKEGTDALVERAAAVAQKTILNVYDKILATLGKDAESAARKTIQTWLDKIAEQKKIDIIEQLVGTLYQIEPFKEQLDTWLDGTGTALEALNEITDAVGDVQGKFIVLAGYAGQLTGALGLLRKAAKFYPPILPITASFQTALLATLVYAGWDYIGYGQVGFLSITNGVAEVIQKRLGIAG